MQAVRYSKKRLSAALEEIDRLKQGDFPYPHAGDALNVIEKELKTQLARLNNLPLGGSLNVANLACILSLESLWNSLPLLGFILRSTNTRNSFESYSPLLRLARRILDPTTKLLISSEWDYSPFVYTVALTNFVLIGLPASESSNPLLLPLAGHEIGHCVWRKENLKMNFEKEVQFQVLNQIKNSKWSKYHELFPQHAIGDLDSELFAQNSWQPAFQWAMKQIEEIFCDCLGIRIFYESYLLAFSYLLSPRMHGQRSFTYPNIKRRANYLEMAAQKFDVVIPAGFSNEFENQDDPKDEINKLFVSIADEVSAGLVDRVIIEAEKIGNKQAIPFRDKEAVGKIQNEFRKLVPASNSASFTDIVNAGWQCYLDDDLWSDSKAFIGDDRDRILSDLILKTMEVFEVEERLKLP